MAVLLWMLLGAPPVTPHRTAQVPRPPAVEFLPGLTPAPAAAQTAPDPALAPPPEELDERSRRWVTARRRGAIALLGSLAIATVIIGVVRRSHRRRPPGSAG